MPRFSSKSLSKLSTCHIDLQVLFFEVIKMIDCTVLEGHRGQVEQEAAFAAGNSKLHYPDGKHNSMPSNAIDVSPYPVEWKNLNAFYFFGGYVLGIAQRLKDEGRISHSIRYGGDFNSNYIIGDDKGLRDLVHFELVT